jgi:heat shock protein 1/8
MQEFEGAIGIDLGTTYSCVAVFLFNNVDVIPNDQGNRTTPSRVAYQPTGQILVGDSALNLSARGVPNVIYDAKRMIGRSFQDPEVQADSKIWAFPIKEDSETGRILIPIEGIAGQQQPLMLEPEQVSAKVLSYLKECAQRHLGKKVTKAVITVPAYFNDAQRERTRAAGAIAGLDVLRIINEPTAAALCYGLGIGTATGAQGSTEAQNIVVFDFGGGTFDVSVITIDGGAFEVRSTAGDTHLGGQDLDAAVCLHLLQDIKKRFGKDVSGNPKVLAKLRAASERAKRSLSSTTMEEISLDGLLDGDDYTFTLSRAKFDELNAKTFKKCMDVVQRALSDSKIDRKQIHEVIMVGGSSRIPKVRELVSEFFNGKKLCTSVNPDEAIAIGAAIQAAILSNCQDQQSSKTEGVVLMDVVSLSIGLEVDRGKFDCLIPRNTTIPYTASKSFTTFEDNQSYVDIEVYEGERPMVKHNHLLGSFVLDGIGRAKKGVPSIDVTFSVDANGILTVTAEEKGSRTKNKIVVENKDRLSNEQIESMIRAAEQLRQADEAVMKKIDRIGASEEEIGDLMKKVDELLGGTYNPTDGDGEGDSSTRIKLPSSVRRALEKLQPARDWLENSARDSIANPNFESHFERLDKLLDTAFEAVKLALLDRQLDKRTKRAEREQDQEDEKGGSGSDDDDDDANEEDLSDDDEHEDRPKKKKSRKETSDTKKKEEKKEKKKHRKSKKDNAQDPPSAHEDADEEDLLLLGGAPGDRKRLRSDE